MRTLVIGATRKWAEGLALLNVALDQNHGPHLSGCADCNGVVMIDRGTGAVTKDTEYCALGHVNCFAQRDGRRVASISGLLMASASPDGSEIPLVYSDNETRSDFAVNIGVGTLTLQCLQTPQRRAAEADQWAT